MFKTMTGVMDPKKNPSEEEINKIPSYIFCRWLSGSAHCIQAANMINVYHNIPMVNQYKMIKAAFGGRVKYIPYPKNNDEKILKQQEYVARHFNINADLAKEYIEFMDEKELNNIIEMYEEAELKGK